MSREDLQEQTLLFGVSQTGRDSWAQSCGLGSGDELGDLISRVLSVGARRRGEEHGFRGWHLLDSWWDGSL